MVWTQKPTEIVACGRAKMHHIFLAYSPFPKLAFFAYLHHQALRNDFVKCILS